jgi:predicted dehydrogenase
MINVAVVGYGYWGPNLVRNFAELPDARVAAVCDLDSGRLERAAQRFPGIKTTSDPGELARDPSIDALVIATPVSTHFELALQALKADKHVLVEKPLTANSDQARRLIDGNSSAGCNG